jgi:glycosyltransferase involved in cell wall biosynthesis
MDVLYQLSLSAARYAHIKFQVSEGFERTKRKNILPMYKEKKIGVVVPAYNEELLISQVITTMPDFVDRIIVVDDASTDQTYPFVQTFLDQGNDRLILIHHEKTQGVGGAIITGHCRALEEGMDVIAVMAGDAQMDPAELANILDPVVEDAADYSKGNRFINGEAWKHMPRVRYFANASLSMLNKIAIGYWHISDPQCGYTAISRRALNQLDLNLLGKGYHFENSVLLLLNVNNLRVMDVPIRAIYGMGEKSGINHFWALISFSSYLLRVFIWRLKEKYVIRDFHPLVFFYAFGMVFFTIGLALGVYLVAYRLFIGVVRETSALFATFLFTSGLQLLLFAMWFDKDYQRKS